MGLGGSFQFSVFSFQFSGGRGLGAVLSLWGMKGVLAAEHPGGNYGNHNNLNPPNQKLNTEN